VGSNPTATAKLTRPKAGRVDHDSSGFSLIQSRLVHARFVRDPPMLSGAYVVVQSRVAANVAAVPMKVREMLRLIEDDGWYLVATVGSHRQYKHPTKTGRVTVPGKLGRDLPIGTERSILRQAGLNRRQQ